MTRRRLARARRAAWFGAWLALACAGQAARPARAAALTTGGHLDLNLMGGFAGTRQLGTESSALLQAGAHLDTGRAGWWRGGALTMQLEGVRAAGDPAAGTRALQWPDNEWAPDFLRVYQFTVRQRWQDTLVRAGIMDINQYFESSDVADLLHNASFGLAPTFTANFNDPSFPNPGLGAMVQWRPAAAWSARAGIWQGDPPGLRGALRRGALRVLELEHAWGPVAGGATPDDVEVGVWRYTQPDPALGADSSGAYLVEQLRWRQAWRHWGSFVLAGDAPAQGNQVRRFVAAGVLLTHPFAERPHDAASVGLTQVRVTTLHAETVAEATYSWRVSSDVALQPDLQRVWNPGGQGAPAWIAGLRLHLVFQ